MRWYILACVAAALAGEGCAACDACIDSLCYTKHLLPDAMGELQDIYRNTNTLYVRNTYFDCIIQCNLDTATCSNITNISSFYKLTVNQRTGELDVLKWVIKFDGRIYKSDPVAKIKISILLHKNVSDFTFQDILYFSGGYNKQWGIFTFENGLTSLYHKYNVSIVDRIIVDKNSCIYFGYPQITRMNINKEITTFQGSIYRMSVDRDGNVIYFNESHAVYRLTNDQLVEVGAVNTVGLSILFDRDNNFVISHGYDRPNYHYRKNNDTYCIITIKDGKRIITKTDGPTTEFPSKSTSTKDDERIITMTDGPTTEFLIESTSSLASDDGAGDSGTNTNHDRTCTCVPLVTGLGIGLAVIIIINATAVIFLYRKDKRKAPPPTALAPLVSPIIQQQMISTWDGYYDMATESANAGMTQGLYEEIK